MCSPESFLKKCGNRKKSSLEIKYRQPGNQKKPYVISSSQKRQKLLGIFEYCSEFPKLSKKNHEKNMFHKGLYIWPCLKIKKRIYIFSPKLLLEMCLLPAETLPVFWRCYIFAFAWEFIIKEYNYSFCPKYLSKMSLPAEELPFFGGCHIFELV